MPILHSTYSTPWYFRNGHLQTILPALFRQVRGVNYKRERIFTSDDDFLDLDWSAVGSSQLVLISHGLEGSSETQYAKGMCKSANRNNMDALVWNYRGCSGAVNKQPRFYHSGETGDLDTVMRHVLALGKYHQIYLIGFSVGGNITLKYLGEQKYPIPGVIKCAVTFSVPCDLAGCALQLAGRVNWIYMNRFIKSLSAKIKSKALIFPEKLDVKHLKNIKNFQQFDTQYTAPLHSYSSAEDYWEANSSKQFLKNIYVPTLIVTAQNDPFLSPSCYPILEAQSNKNLFLEMPKYGGHCGFGLPWQHPEYWSEWRAINFIKEWCELI